MRDIHTMAHDMHETVEYIVTVMIKITCIANLRSRDIEEVAKSSRADLEKGIVDILARNLVDLDIDVLFRDVVLMTRDTVQKHLDL